MKTTFKNENTTGNIEEMGLESMQSVADDFGQFALDELNGEENEELGALCDYGLSFEKQLNDETEELEYYRYQLSWGGPSDEIRFYPSGKIEYVFLDWFCGIGFDVTSEEWAQWARDQLVEL